MSGVVLSSKGLSPGCKVRLAAQDGDDRYECTAIVDSIDLNARDPIVKAKGCREIKSGVLEPGIQIFTQSELIMLEVLEKPAAAEAEPTAACSRSRRSKGGAAASACPSLLGATTTRT